MTNVSRQGPCGLTEKGGDFDQSDVWRGLCGGRAGCGQTGQGDNSKWEDLLC